MMDRTDRSLPYIDDDVDVRGRRVLVRASLDVPLESGRVRDAFRIMRALPTLRYLVGAGAKVIVIAHIGRDPSLSLEPVANVLREHVPVTFVPNVTGEDVKSTIRSMSEGSIVLLENLRKDPGEKMNDETFTRTLASYGDIYVNDAFTVSHRAHASVAGLPKVLPSYFGLDFREEYTHLSAALKPEHPALFIIGGAKFETKEPLVEKYINEYEAVFVGGALANDLLKAKGFEVGRSLVSDKPVTNAALLESSKLLIPIDITVAKDDSSRVTTLDDVQGDEMIADAGPETVAMLKERIAGMRTVVWNGPIGYYEGGYDTETKELAKIIAECDAHSILGGGDTIAAIKPLGINDKFGFLSSAGGAMLTFLELGTLPGIDAILDNPAT